MSPKLPSFRNPTLFQQALTHSSFLHDHPHAGPDYERLEFLGDGVVEFVVRDLMMARFPHLSVGDLSKRCDGLTDETSLAALAVELGLVPLLRLSHSARAQRDNPSLHADSFEAVVGAYYLDSGMEAAYRFVADLFTPLLEQVPNPALANPVSTLQEYVQARLGGTLPEYRLQREFGPDHDKGFEFAVYIDQQPYGVGQGHSKKEAKKQAALAALQRMGQVPPDLVPPN